MPKYIKILMAVCGLILLLLIVMVEFVIPSQLKKQIRSQIEVNCRSCEFSTEGVDLRLFPTRVVFDEVHFVTGDAKSTLVDVHTERVILTISTRMLMGHLVKLKQIVIEKPVVTVTEGDLKGSQSPSNESPSPWDLEIDHIDLKDGQFTYQREHLGKVGILQIGSINGSIGELGSTSARRDQPVIAHVTAILEQSGKIDLTVKPILFSSEIHVDVSLGLKGLNLAETNRYFGPDDGIKIKGIINEAQSEVSVRGRDLHAQLSVDYHGLSLKFRKTAERSGLKALITNLFSGVKPVKDRGRSATTNRNPGEPLVGFILRGMKEAALKVATD